MLADGFVLISCVFWLWLLLSQTRSCRWLHLDLVIWPFWLWLVTPSWVLWLIFVSVSATSLATQLGFSFPFTTCLLVFSKSPSALETTSKLATYTRNASYSPLCMLDQNKLHSQGTTQKLTNWGKHHSWAAVPGFKPDQHGALFGKFLTKNAHQKCVSEDIEDRFCNRMAYLSLSALAWQCVVFIVFHEFPEASQYRMAFYTDNEWEVCKPRTLWTHTFWLSVLNLTCLCLVDYFYFDFDFFWTDWDFSHLFILQVDYELLHEP